jgi:hypothetical protein
LTPVSFGQPATWRVTGMNPGETAFFGVSPAGLGNGPCAPSLGGLCLDIANPVTLLGTAVADLTGTATLTINVPNAPGPCLDVALQAAVRDGPGGANSVASDPIELTVSSPGATCGPPAAQVVCGATNTSPNGLLGDLALGTNPVIDTTTGEIRDDSGVRVAASLTAGATSGSNPGVTVHTQSPIGGFASPQIVAFHVGDFSVPSGQTLSVVGDRALAILSDGALVVDGTLDVSGDPGVQPSTPTSGAGGAAGPGGWDGGAFGSNGCAFDAGRADGPGSGGPGQCGPGGDDGLDGIAEGGGGGGGGACGSSAGAGGSHATQATSGEPGTFGAAGNNGLPDPAFGGNGGFGGFPCQNPPAGGSRGSTYGVTDLSTLTGGTGGSAGGGSRLGGNGGRGGNSGGFGGLSLPANGAGGGGGAGGAVLLCAQTEVVVNGAVRANGGSGGSAGFSSSAETGQGASFFGSGPRGGGGGGGGAGRAGAGGGGAGGAVHLWSPRVEVAGSVVAIGGNQGFAFGGGFGGAGGPGRDGGLAGGRGGSGGGDAYGGNGGNGYITVHTDDFVLSGSTDGRFSQFGLP